MAEHPEVFHHVGLLTNEPPATLALRPTLALRADPVEMRRVALYLVIRRLFSDPTTSTKAACWVGRGDLESTALHCTATPDHSKRFQNGKRNVDFVLHGDARHSSRRPLPARPVGLRRKYDSHTGDFENRLKITTARLRAKPDYRGRVCQALSRRRTGSAESNIMRRSILVGHLNRRCVSA